MERDVDELIGQLLSGTLSPEDTAWLNSAMAKDPALKDMVDELWVQHTIEQYVEGELSTEEKAAFEKRLDEDPDLQESLENYRVAHSVLAMDRQRDYSELFAEIGREGKKKPPGNLNWLWSLLSLAVLAVGLFFLYGEDSDPTAPTLPEELPGEEVPAETPDPNLAPKNTPQDRPLEPPSEEELENTPPVAKTPEEIREENLQLALAEYLEQPFDFKLSGAKGGNTADSLFREGFTNWTDAYQKRDYDRMIAVIDGIDLPLNTRQAGYKDLAMAMAYLGKNDPDRALTYLNQILERPADIPTDAAEWYKILILLKKNSGSVEARDLLQQIRNALNHQYKAPAAALLNRLN